MRLTWDENKRQKVLVECGLDMASVEEVFAGVHRTKIDDRIDYGEIRHVTYGYLKDRLCAVVWTRRGDMRHVISLRKANDREQKIFWAGMG
jgi:uncharacterized protein